MPWRLGSRSCKSEDSSTFKASAFHFSKSTVTNATGIDALEGTATYTGGAAGKYALYSATGGTNDAGQLTADATIEADLGDNSAVGKITGTIYNFTGADGMARDWSVELEKNMMSQMTA